MAAPAAAGGQAEDDDDVSTFIPVPTNIFETHVHTTLRSLFDTPEFVQFELSQM